MNDTIPLWELDAPLREYFKRADALEAALALVAGEVSPRRMPLRGCGDFGAALAADGGEVNLIVDLTGDSARKVHRQLLDGLAAVELPEGGEPCPLCGAQTRLYEGRAPGAWWIGGHVGHRPGGNPPDDVILWRVEENRMRVWGRAGTRVRALLGLPARALA